jgi:predicted XRE-type DNA-binding protein
MATRTRLAAPVEEGSGNVFRDLGLPNADALQLKSVLAVEIIRILEKRGLSVRQAHVRTRIAASDFSRIRRADLDRFTVDRLMEVLDRLGQRVEIAVKVRPSRRPREVLQK